MSSEVRRRNDEPALRPVVDSMLGFRSELLAAGLLAELGVPGIYATSATFESIAAAVSHLVVERGADQHARSWRFPAIYPKAAFEKSGYLRSFPHLIGSLKVFVGDDRDHSELLAHLEAGRDWDSALRPAEVAMCSAACHPLYPIVEKCLPVGGQRYDVLGLVYRNEPSLDPARMQTFRQHEFVYLGEPDIALAHRDEWLARAADLLSGLGLGVTSVVANDPFFGRSGRLLTSSQRSQVLKYELVATISDENAPTAIASSNLHGDHFGTAFDIRTATGAVAHSACVGFGLERITLALIKAHGLVPANWPKPVRDKLWPSCP